MNPYQLDWIRSQIIGKDLLFETPFGKRHLLYADYTASGRGLKFVEEKVNNILASYANTHTEDDYTGKYLTQLLHQAETRIKKLVNAGEHGRIISVGSGATGALLKLQQILGIYIPPVTRERLYQSIEKSRCADEGLLEEIEFSKPVIFVSAYEHHSNELMWRESFAEVVVIGLKENSLLDLEDLKTKLKADQYKDRSKLASFSAGSNITGVKTDVYEVARICHGSGVPVMFDFAAIAPYVEIDMNRDGESYFDAIFFSPHKFLGGPGTSGILIFNEDLYRKDLPPTAAGGGTVDYVGYHAHDFMKDIESREKAGTPPILQTIKTALIMDLKDKIGCDVIEDQDDRLSRIFFNRINKIENIELIGDIPMDKRVPIISFNIRHQDRFLHPKFVTKLLNDLFGIQSRAGCSCAGPYGHYLLKIDEAESERFRTQVSLGNNSIKPGWVRVNLHYTFDERDIEFLLDAIEFVARSGYLFLTQYHLNIESGEWSCRDFKATVQAFSIENDFSFQQTDMTAIADLRSQYLDEAENMARELRLEPEPSYCVDSSDIEAIKFFHHL